MNTYISEHSREDLGDVFGDVYPLGMFGLSTVAARVLIHQCLENAKTALGKDSSKASIAAETERLVRIEKERLQEITQ